NYYSSTTVIGSTNHGTGGDASVEGNCGAPGQPACATKGNCGGVGQPLCKVDIDESGMPSGSGYGPPGFDQDGAKEGVEDGGQASPADGVAPSFIPVLNGTGCGSLTFNLPKGYVLTIPGAGGCAFLDRIKAIVGFFLAIFTAFTCWQRFVDSI
ncbi:MAG: hypothetical protein ACREUE_17490, partial [Panacagrimonas sp.]